MSDFARKQLMKYGWSEGKGLGKKEDGMIEPIKPIPKYDTCGIGHDRLKDITDRWWDQAYNKAVSSLKIINNEKGVVIKKKKEKKKNKNRKISEEDEFHNAHTGFLKAEILSADGVIINTSGDSTFEDTVTELQTWENEEEMFKVCGGRTAHKAARHGLKMSGKLKRIQEQEEILSKDDVQLNFYQSNSEDHMTKSSLKRCCVDEDEKHFYNHTNRTSSLGGSNKKHKKKKNKK